MWLRGAEAEEGGRMGERSGEQEGMVINLGKHPSADTDMSELATLKNCVLVRGPKVWALFTSIPAAVRTTLRKHDH